MADPETRRHIIAFIWTWHAVFTAALAYTICNAAYKHSGFPFCRPRRAAWCNPLIWPVTGRWLLGGFFWSLAILFAIVAATNWQGDAVLAPGWWRVASRAIPGGPEAWLAWRSWRRGLLNDPGREGE